MSSKTLVERQCGDKRRFADIETASKIRDNYEAKHGDKMSTYKCPWCGFYHIGHQKNAKSQIKEAALPSIDRDMTLDEVNLEIALLKPTTADCQLQLSRACTPAHREKIIVRMHLNDVRLSQLKARRQQLLNEQKAAHLVQPLERDKATAFSEYNSEQLLDVFFQSAKELAQRYRKLLETE